MATYRIDPHMGVLRRYFGTLHRTGPNPDGIYYADSEYEARAQYKRQLIRMGLSAYAAEEITESAYCYRVD